jgi:hypothetical protein
MVNNRQKAWSPIFKHRVKHRQQHMVKNHQKYGQQSSKHMVYNIITISTTSAISGTARFFITIEHGWVRPRSSQSPLLIPEVAPCSFPTVESYSRSHSRSHSRPHPHLTHSYFHLSLTSLSLISVASHSHRALISFSFISLSSRSRLPLTHLSLVSLSSHSHLPLISLAHLTLISLLANHFFHIFAGSN